MHQSHRREPRIIEWMRLRITRNRRRWRGLRCKIISRGLNQDGLNIDAGFSAPPEPCIHHPLGSLTLFRG
jgi:hypothetical protein